MQTDDLSSSTILIVDDEPINIRLLQRLLASAGYHEITSTTDSRTVLDLYRSRSPDIILLDLMMPHLDGLAVLEQLRAEIPADVYLPVLILTAEATFEVKKRALAAGTHDFLTKPFESFEVLLRIRNLLNTRRMYLAQERQNQALEELVRRRTAQLLQSEKIAAMGSLLAGVAHELNNPLTVLSGQAQLLLGANDPVMVRRATQIQRAADRCVRIVRNFLALARQQPPERVETRLAQVLQGSVELLAYECRTDNVQVAVELAEELPVLWADPHQLHQVFVNMMGNAHQAMRRQERPRSIRVIGRYDRDANRVRVQVVDSGPGMSAEIQARIFEPFFTTKPVGEGTGLGLSLCRAIIEEHGGSVAVESAPERGTTFIIDLPVVGPPTRAPGVAISDVSMGARASRILVVDDEPAVAEVIAQAVERDGHTADIAENGAQALQRLAQGAYDLVISDSKMPVLDGEEFYVEVGRRFPRLQRRVIFLTGDVLSAEKRQFLQQTGAPFLAKPCDLGELRRLVQRALTQG